MVVIQTVYASNNYFSNFVMVAAFVFLLVKLADVHKVKYIFVKMSSKPKKICIEVRELLTRLRKVGNCFNSIAKIVNHIKAKQKLEVIAHLKFL